MKTITKKLYEAMFLVDSSKAASDWDGTQASIKDILEKGQAEIVSMSRWDERRLAYEIDGYSRGTYVLCYFRVDGERIGEIERYVQLSEQILRVLILSAEHVSEEDLEKAIPATAAEEDKQGAGGASAENVEAAQKGPAEAEQGTEKPEQSAEVGGEGPAETDTGETEQAGEKKTDSGEVDGEEVVGEGPAETNTGKMEQAGEKKTDSGEADAANEQAREEAADSQAGQ